MAKTRVSDELTDLRRSFEKVLEESSNESERLNDILDAMMKIVGEFEILKQTGVVVMLKGACKKLGDSPVVARIKELMAKWKEDCAKPAPPGKKADVNPPEEAKSTAQKEESTASAPPPAVSRCISEDVEFDDGGYLKGLPPNRQTVPIDKVIWYFWFYRSYLLIVGGWSSCSSH